MQKLWQRTLALLRNHPILWAPYLCAACLTSALTTFRRLEDKRIVHWLATRTTSSHSILSPGLVDSHFDEATFFRSAQRIHYILQWAFDYVYDLMYALAIVLTALLVNMILSEQGADLRAAFSVLRTYPKRILVYASKYWMLSLVLTLIVTIPATKLYEALLAPRYAVFNELFIGVDILWALVTAWVMAPITIALLRPAGAVAPDAAEKRQARYIYFFIQTAAFLLIHFIHPLMYKLPLKSSVQGVVMDSAGIVFNLPFVPLYVAFALIAQPYLLNSQAERPSAILAFLSRHRKSLMPLHFGQGKEL
jgi:hypothetical protein